MTAQANATTTGKFEAEIHPDFERFDANELSFWEYRQYDELVLMGWHRDRALTITFLDYEKIEAGRDYRIYPDSDGPVTVDILFSTSDGQWETLKGGTLFVNAIDLAKEHISVSFRFDAKLVDDSEIKLIGSANLTGYSELEKSKKLKDASRK
ncbi:hypothetical protein [Pseudomonas sp. dw_612]|uniref:hypothetical protein n=1 Tax=Pseudomonas sp. dw_612 TaxID=2720080 RepID=UPI001BD5B2FD|nr:hypothetical protein [Pseudomonas sp. dw_612]